MVVVVVVVVVVVEFMVVDGGRPSSNTASGYTLDQCLSVTFSILCCNHEDNMTL